MKHLSLLFVLILLAACSPAAPAPAATQPDYLQHTAAANTIVAQLTEASAAQLTLTPGAGLAATADPLTAAPATAASGSDPSATFEALPATSTPRPTRTALPSDTPQPTETALPSPTPGPTQITNGLGEALFKDTFDQPGNWPFYNSYFVEMNLRGGALNMTALIPSRDQPRDNWMVTDQTLADGYVEALVTTGECEGLDRYGLIVRAAADASTGYLFGVSCDGNYSLRLWDGSHTIAITAWLPSPHILRGAEQINRIAIRMQGERFWMYANGKELGQASDDTFAGGAFGPFVGAVNTAKFTVSYDELSAWEILTP